MEDVKQNKWENGFHGEGWSGGPVAEEQADEDPAFLDEVEILQGDSSCMGDSLKDVLKDMPHVRRVQLVAEKLGVRARPDAHCFRHLWIEDRDEKGVDRLLGDCGYFIISVNEHGFYVGVGELVGWDRLEEWFEMAAVKKVQDS